VAVVHGTAEAAGTVSPSVRVCSASDASSVSWLATDTRIEAVLGVDTHRGFHAARTSAAP
jgi:hypothetical protein